MKNANYAGYPLDAIDIKVITMLMDNSKSSLVHISKNVGISTTAVHQRIKKLEHAGVIDSSASFLNPKMLGYSVIAYIGVFLRHPDLHESTTDALKIIDEIVEAHFTTGNYSIFLKVICRDNTHLLEVLNKIKQLESVRSTETIISMEQTIGRQLKV